MTSPPIPLRAWYLVGGRLPLKYREWVFHQATKRTWLAWFVVRAFLQVLPLTVVIALALVWGLDSPLPLAVACGSLGLVVGVYFAVSYAIESTDHRMTKYGYPRASASTFRKARNTESDQERERRYNEAWRSGE
ncbi:DUF5313 family protein [Actinosynnema sp. NPDC047251]|uniref:Putative membrane protein n=1 Tax=Saccharothrix espanaensis (strain ATCC 51144 / DSM 44229 / JCM 9112 / NBRC 15066 / NRRL 15764) TaxID=1179773 RepID=K0KBK1_SACES|nr:DUF5313 family protein [Saccharothrix espanaensis]CCH35571.1 putative membrane protein [Saccharothrix espanaensis DSM 44229]